MAGPLDASLPQFRRWILIFTVVTLCMTVVTTARSGFIVSGWSNATGSLLGGLAGTHIGERLARFGLRTEAIGIGWLQMAALAMLVVYAVVYSALPAYCQLPLNFAMGFVFIATIVYIRGLKLP